jgi:hypothetical protein
MGHGGPRANGGNAAATAKSQEQGRQAGRPWKREEVEAGGGQVEERWKVGVEQYGTRKADEERRLTGCRLVVTAPGRALEDVRFLVRANQHPRAASTDGNSVTQSLSSGLGCRKGEPQPLSAGPLWEMRATEITPEWWMQERVWDLGETATEPPSHYYWPTASHV